MLRQQSATKSNLLRLREALALARQGLELLEQKKDVLAGKISRLEARASMVRQRVDKDLIEAYRHLDQALLLHGEAAVAGAGLGTRLGARLIVREKSLMGVVLPLVEISSVKPRPSFGPVDTGPEMDLTALTVIQGLDSLAELAEVEIGVERILAELKRTLKRINALKYIYIPRYEKEVKRVEAMLEEKERDALFQQRLLKGRRGASLQGR